MGSGSTNWFGWLLRVHQLVAWKTKNWEKSPVHELDQVLNRKKRQVHELGYTYNKVKKTYYMSAALIAHGLHSRSAY